MGELNGGEPSLIDEMLVIAGEVAGQDKATIVNGRDIPFNLLASLDPQAAFVTGERSEPVANNSKLSIDDLKKIAIDNTVLPWKDKIDKLKARLKSREINGNSEAGVVITETGILSLERNGSSLDGGVGELAKLRGLSFKNGDLLSEFNGKFSGFALSFEAADRLTGVLPGSIDAYGEGVQRRLISLAENVSFEDAADFIFNQIGGRATDLEYAFILEAVSNGERNIDVTVAYNQSLLGAVGARNSSLSSRFIQGLKAASTDATFTDSALNDLGVSSVVINTLDIGDRFLTFGLDGLAPADLRNGARLMR